MGAERMPRWCGRRFERVVDGQPARRSRGSWRSAFSGECTSVFAPLLQPAVDDRPPYSIINIGLIGDSRIKYLTACINAAGRIIPIREPASMLIFNRSAGWQYDLGNFAIRVIKELPC